MWALGGDPCVDAANPPPPRYSHASRFPCPPSLSGYPYNTGMNKDYDSATRQDYRIIHSSQRVATTSLRLLASLILIFHTRARSRALLQVEEVQVKKTTL